MYNFIKLGAGILFTVSLMSGCSKINANIDKPIVNAENVKTTDSTDPEIESAQKLIASAPKEPKGYTRLAIAYIRLARETGNFSLNSQAEAAIEKALQFAPEDISARKLKASLHLTFHRLAEALEAGQKLNTEFPNDDFVYGVLTDSHVELGNYNEAIEAAQKMVDLKPNMSSYARVAHLRSLHGDHPGALEMFKKAARTADPLDKEAQSWCLVQLGDELWKNGKYAEAEKVFDEALQNFPNYHLALAGKGQVRAANGDFQTAIKFLTEANNRVPNVETAILLGDIHTKQDNPEKARQQYALVEVIEKKMGVNNDQKRLALLWADQNSNLDEALAISKREAELRNDIFTADVLAWCLYKKGQLTEAKAAIAKAMSLNSNEALILYHAGMIEKDLGHGNEAKRLLEQALKLNPMFDLIQSEHARKALSELK
jgi:tetratricopeptide (TPR) repeat protein